MTKINDSFEIVQDATDETYLTIKTKDRGTVVLKIEDEGLVVDVYSIPDAQRENPVAGTYAFLNELEPGLDNDE